MAAEFRTTLTAGQLLVSLPFSYPMGTDDLVVTINGKVLIRGKEYTELSLTQIALAAPAAAGEVFGARVA
jgi:hypothetical protein